MKLTNYIKILWQVGFVLALAASCTKEEDKQLKLKQMFKPVKIKVDEGPTQSTISWSAALFTTPGHVGYLLQVSKDSAEFSSPVVNDTLQVLNFTLTDQMIPIKTKFYARVKALGVNGANDSNWEVSSPFIITGEQLLNQVQSADLIDKSIIFRWQPSADFTQIVIMPPGGATPIVITLNAAQALVGSLQFDGLTASTAYTAQIFKGSLEKGTVKFTTKAGDVTGTNPVIDLRGIIGKPTVLSDTLPKIPSGSVVLLKRGQSYTISGSVALTNSVTITSGLDFGTNLAMIQMVLPPSGGSSNFTIASGTVIDSVVFKDVIIKGSRALGASYLNDYVFNTTSSYSSLATIGVFKLNNCIVKILRGVTRLQAGLGGARITKYIVNNCVLDSIREYGVATVNNAASWFNTISITNSTIYKTRKFINHATAGNTSLTIKNCTFNESPSNAGTSGVTFMDFSAVNTIISVDKCIFGKVWDETGTAAITGYKLGGSGSILVTNSFGTSDFTFTTNPLSVTTYTGGTSTAVFIDPNGNFRIKDNAFPGKNAGAGDPRWK